MLVCERLTPKLRHVQVVDLQRITSLAWGFLERLVIAAF